MFGKSLRSTFTKLASGMKEATNKTVSAIKHKGSVAEVPDEMYEWYLGSKGVGGRTISRS